MYLLEIAVDSIVWLLKINFNRFLSILFEFKSGFTSCCSHVYRNRYDYIDCGQIKGHFEKSSLIKQQLDSYSKWIRQKCYQFFINEKLKKYFVFYLHFTQWNNQRILKNSHFENMSAGFLLSCQNSLRWNTAEKMHYQEWFFFTNIAPLIVIALTIFSLCCIYVDDFYYFLGP